MFEFRCRDMDLDDDCVITGNTKEEVMDKVAQYLSREHNYHVNEVNYDEIYDLIE